MVEYIEYKSPPEKLKVHDHKVLKEGSIPQQLKSRPKVETRMKSVNPSRRVCTSGVKVIRWQSVWETRGRAPEGNKRQ